MRDLDLTEIAEVSGGDWKDWAQIAGGIGAVAAGTAYSVKTGGIGAYFGGGSVVAAGTASIASGMEGLMSDWYG